MKIFTLTILFILISAFVFGQKGKIEGRVFNVKNNEPIPFSNIQVTGKPIGSTSDFDGNFIITGVEPGFVTLTVSSLGFETYITGELQVTNNKTVFIDIPMNETALTLNEVKITASKFRRVEESPVSIRTLSAREIENNPGANRDISRVVQSLPGIAVLPGPQRNDVIVRGGAANESRFYLDGVEIPNINHFATQGASGGSNGILNADFIREVEFYSGAFPANRGNALSGVFNFKQIDGNKEKTKYRATLGASEVSLTVDGPAGEKTSYILSARRSYLQFLFKAIGLPFLPTFNDFQFKSKTRFDEKNELTIIGLGAIDQFRLDTDIENPDEYQRYILDYLPVQEQWNYTLGAVYKHYREKGYHTLVLSRNMLNNSRCKYFNNIESNPNNKILDYDSWESENKLRYENTIRSDNGLKVNYGLNTELAKYNNQTFQKVYRLGVLDTVNYSSDLSLLKWGVFGQVSKKFLDERLILSLGVRTDANSYSKSMQNLAEQISPRFSASYLLTEKLSFNFNTGRYYQLPAYTTLGYRDASGELVNKNNELKYIRSDHLIAGFEYRPNSSSKVSLEGFYKNYANYPFSVKDSVSLANRPADFGTFGDEEVVSESEGRVYGVELLYQAAFKGDLNMVTSYSYSVSEFMDKNGGYVPSSWDNRHIFIAVLSKQFKKNWVAGFKWRFAGGLPYTPYDLDRSSMIDAWNVTNQPYLDYTRLNSQRFGNFHQLDIRVDKAFYLDKFSVKLYVDIQNLYNFKSEEQGIITNTNKDGVPVIDPSDNNRYVLRTIESEGSGTVLPTIGIIVDF
ncbi:MAG: TonB-dependent receptor [Marinilabiliales bacterium]|nr:MAG: TonB-dependent receptor [Marinilabiliales bacterium]